MGVNAVGWVPSVHPYLNSARVSVVPLLYGAGTKRKLIQALRAGTPTVSTSVGVEGLGVKPGSEVLVADDAPSFAASVERLIEDQELWSRLADAGRKLIEPAYSRATTHTRFRDAVAEVLEREPNVSASCVPATATRERAPLPDPPDCHESSEEMRPSIMRREWDERAKLNPMHYIASNKVVWDEEDFFSGGAGDVERYVGSDLDAICGGREAKALRMLEIGCGMAE